jgi:uncharacterized protein RhaS with RHS repeats
MYNRRGCPPRADGHRARGDWCWLELQSQVRARWYDPHLGRFISQDPIGLAGGINPYAYADNSPTNLRDPSGLCSVNEYMLDECRAVDIEPIEVVGRRRGNTLGWSSRFGNRGNGVFAGVAGPAWLSPGGGGGGNRGGRTATSDPRHPSPREALEYD